MVIEILDALDIYAVIAIGHSWGSMSILRAAHDNPARFTSIGLCNMPFERATFKTRFQFRMQHLLLGFRKFYTKQVARALFGYRTFKADPGLLALLESSMGRLSASEIREIDTAVITNAENTEPLIRSLAVPALALRGKEDYVPESAYIRTTTVRGGHVSPAEAPEEVLRFIRSVSVNNDGG
jgi:pimeloyl-ACP methyl ester carboxylesterase